MNRPPMLDFANVDMRFPDGTHAIDQVSLTIATGQFCVLLGPSGAGKSTLLRIANGLCEPMSGYVTIAGQQRWPRTRASGRYKVATIHQGVDLVERLTVLDNVLTGVLAELPAVSALLGLFGTRRKRLACELLSRVGLNEIHLYRRACELSGGQQQRVGVARALMSEPALILADEPVASLDPRTSREVLMLLQQITRELGVTVLCSLHDVELARQFADRIIGMSAGRIAFDVEPGALDKSGLNGLYAAAA
jgi:phosphonate transport system ATP-binding protein